MTPSDSATAGGSAPVPAPEKKPAGGAAGVEIAGFPQVLYTRTFGDPDMLFVPLLDAAREAFQKIERLIASGEDRAAAVTLSTMHLASSLLRDSSFTLVAKGRPHENTYTVDLGAGTLLVNTRLFAVVSRRTSFFKVEIAGKITEGPYVVRNPAQGSIIMQVGEDRIRQPNFFASSLAQECLRVQMEQERFGRIAESQHPHPSGELRLLLNVGGGKIPVILRQKEDGSSWDIVDGRRQESVGVLAPEMEAPLSGIITFIQGLFSQK